MMNFKKSVATIIAVFIISVSFAQFDRFLVDVTVGQEVLEFGLAGGLIAPQFSAVDLNNDGTEDLFVFDKAGNVSLTFINKGTANQVDYEYAPQYEKYFPPLNDWVMLRDYNNDGVKDIFAYNKNLGVDGINVYTGKFAGGRIQFEQIDFTHIIASNVIPYPAGNGFSNIYVTKQDYPAIDDIDGDGDLDIVTFANGGGYVYYYDNMSVELGYGTDSLIYELEDVCWGKFYESGISEVVDLSDDISICATGFVGDDGAAETRHAGSTVLTLDNDADGDKEVILGDLSFSNLNMLTNGGTPDLAWMVDQDVFFPSYNISADINVFPASFYVDVNNDGVRDLLASPNVWKTGENHEVVWYYKNNGADNDPDFQFLEKEFLVGDMIDMGREAHPTFVDYNADGLLDLVVGNNSFFVPGGETRSRIFLYENTGTATNPTFKLVDEDYLGFSVNDGSPNNSPAPTFGDIDNDGDMDVLIGETGGGFYFGENIAGPGNQINIPVLQFNYMGLDLAVASKPQLVDLNRDGKLDIVAGEKNGQLVYFQNEGTPEEPMFIPNINTQTPDGNNIISLGLVDTKLGGFIGYADPFFYDFGGTFGLFAGSDKGNILKYSNIDNNLDGTFTLDTDFYGEIRPGFITSPAVVDIDNDGVLEMFVGNVRGGISAYTTNLMTDGTPVSTGDITNSFSLNIYPNPASDVVNLEIENPNFSQASLRVFNSIGQLVDQSLINDPTTQISTQKWGSGLFILQLEIGKEVILKKLVVN